MDIESLERVTDATVPIARVALGDSNDNEEYVQKRGGGGGYVRLNRMGNWAKILNFMPP